MKFLAAISILLSAILLAVPAASGYSLLNSGDYKKLPSQKDVLKMNTVREPIRMPSQTPMVPWKVRYQTLARVAVERRIIISQ
jgi:hypothetical protein